MVRASAQGAVRGGPVANGRSPPACSLASFCGVAMTTLLSACLNVALVAVLTIVACVALGVRPF